MKLEKGNPWGLITGKISMSPDQALRTFSFVMRPDATGIIIRHYKSISITGHIKNAYYVSNYIDAGNPQSNSQQLNRAKFALLSQLAKAHKTDLIVPIWNPLSTERRKTMGHGYNEFKSINIQMIKDITDLSTMLISDGELEPCQEITTLTQDFPGIFTFTFPSTCNKNGLLTDNVYMYILNPDTNTLEILEPAGSYSRNSGTITGSGTACFHSFYGYLFFQQGERYSPSRCKEVGRMIAYPTMTDDPYTGAINGSNKVFTTSKNYIADTTRVTYNGIRQKRDTDYTETAVNEITMVTAPLTGEKLIIDYDYWT